MGRKETKDKKPVQFKYALLVKIYIGKFMNCYLNSLK